jgi:hypothetical protein
MTTEDFPDPVRDNYLKNCTIEQKIILFEMDIKNLETMISHYSKSRFYKDEIKHKIMMDKLSERIKLKESEIKKLKKDLST